jgi:hypothetical protein
LAGVDGRGFGSGRVRVSGWDGREKNEAWIWGGEIWKEEGEGKMVFDGD